MILLTINKIMSFIQRIIYVLIEKTELFNKILQFHFNKPKKFYFPNISNVVINVCLDFFRLIHSRELVNPLERKVF